MSAAVLKVSLFLAGIVVLRGISTVMTPPSVSTPSESGVTSSRTTPLTSPARTAPWIAAPMATTSSGLTPLCGSFPKSCVHAVLDLRHPRLAADEHDLVDVLRGDSASFIAFWHGGDRALDEVGDQRFELGPRQRHRQVLGPAGVGGDEREVDVGLQRGAELDLRLLGGFAQALQRHAVPAQVDAVFAFLNSSAIQSITRWSKLSPPRWVSPLVALTSKTPSPSLEDRDVECAAAEVVDRDLFVLLLV